MKITHPAENRLNILLVKIKVELQDSRLKEIISSILPAAFEFMKLLRRKEVQVYIKKNVEHFERTSHEPC